MGNFNFEKCKVPTEEVKQDIEDAKAEINQYEIELHALRVNCPGNKLEILKRESWVSKTKDQIEKMEGVLKYRSSLT